MKVFFFFLGSVLRILQFKKYNDTIENHQNWRRDIECEIGKKIFRTETIWWKQKSKQNHKYRVWLYNYFHLSYRQSQFWICPNFRKYRIILNVYVIIFLVLLHLFYSTTRRKQFENSLWKSLRGTTPLEFSWFLHFSNSTGNIKSRLTHISFYRIHTFIWFGFPNFSLLLWKQFI